MVPIFTVYPLVTFCLTYLHPYRHLIGRLLLYLSIPRTDICYTVNRLSHFMVAHTIVHLVTAHHLLRYLKATPKPRNPVFNIFQVFWQKKTYSNFQIKACIDTDWARCVQGRIYIGNWGPLSFSNFKISYLKKPISCWFMEDWST